MKEKRNGYVENFNYITLSVAMITILAILVLYMPGLREFDVAILKVIRQFLSMFPVAIATFVSYFGKNHIFYNLLFLCHYFKELVGNCIGVAVKNSYPF